MRRKLAWMAAAGLVLSACQQQCYLDDWVDSYMGKTREQIFQEWGTPDKTYKGDDGMETFKYHCRTWDDGGFWKYQPGWVNYEVDFIFKGNTVTHWRYENANCRVVPEKWLKANKKRIDAERRAKKH